MVADLKGQVDIVLDGRIDSYKGGIRTTFAGIPDLPVSKFVINLPGGKHGLLQASTNLCAKPVKGIVSPGMLCAEDELGLGTSHAGIVILSPPILPIVSPAK